MKKTLAILLALVLALGTASLSVCAADTLLIAPAPTTTVSATDSAIEKALTYYEADGTIDFWWPAAAVASAGVEVAFTFDPYSEDTTTTTLAGYAFTAAILGINPANVYSADNVNLFTELASRQYSDGSFGYINETVYAMLALDRFGVEYDRSAALSSVLALQCADGGFGYDLAWGSDIDVTGMVLMVIADETGCEEAVENAIAYLKNNLLEQGGYASWGSENVCTDSAVALGLVAAGEDITGEEWKDLASVICGFQMEDGSFKNDVNDTVNNAMATYQALTALLAIRDGESFWQSADYYVSSLEVASSDINSISDWAYPYACARYEDSCLTLIDGNFAPAAGITRAAFVTALTKVLAVTEEGEHPFADVDTADSVLNAAITTAYNLGWIYGTDETHFSPEATLTREDAAVIIYRALGLTAATPDYADNASISAYAVDAVGSLQQGWIMVGDGTNFYPASLLTREEAAVLLSNLYA